MTDKYTQRQSEEDAPLSALYRSSRREQPSSELDERILAQASTVARHRRRRWLLPISSVAVLLLGLTLTLQLARPPDLPRLEVEPESMESDAALAPPEAQKRLSAPMMREEPARSSPAPAAMAKSRRLPTAPAPRMERMEQELSADTQEDFTTLDQDGATEARQRIKLIEELLDKGDRAAAIQALVALRARYPDFPLPARLQGLVRE